jgi:hypothetical protein
MSYARIPISWRKANHGFSQIVRVKLDACMGGSPTSYMNIRVNPRLFFAYRSDKSLLFFYTLFTCTTPRAN